MSNHPLSSPKIHAQRSIPDADVSTQISTQKTPSEPEEEARPSHTAEIGTLKKLSVPGGTAWLGSSSGVYFVNTVRRAFSAAFTGSSNAADEHTDPDAVPASEDIITGEDATGRNFNGTTTTANRNAWWLHDADFHTRVVAAVGRPPEDQDVAMELVTTFFRTTHPLFPFLHGPKFLDDFRDIYTALGRPNPQSQTQTVKSAGANTRAKRKNSNTNNSPPIPNLDSLRAIDPLKLITFQIIINIAGLSHGTTPVPVPKLPASSTIPSAQALLSLVLPLSTTPLIPTIQLLLAAELYLLSTNSLRLSSTVAGVVLRLIYHSGLHRCPLRYASLTPQDCEIRKRVFWSAYALDRHLSLALGDPNTFQDSDIDVCLSRDGDGEMHRAVARDLLTEEEREVEMRLHYPRDTSGKRVLLVDAGTQKPPQRVGTTDTYTSNSPENSTSKDNDNTSETQHKDTTNTTQPKPVPTSKASGPTSLRSKQLREAALTAYVHYGKLTGRIIEIFHKSINFRFPKEDAIGFLSADIENWWNDLPSTLTGEFTPTSTSTTVPDSSTDNTTTTNTDTNDIDPHLLHQHTLLTPFFTLLYHQLLLLLNRPKLSLSQSSAPFHTGLQTCIRASRATLSSLQKHRANGQSMFLPGLLSATWMSGLIIAFACQLGKYERGRAVGDIGSCLGLLEGMGGEGYSVRNCGKVLRLLVGDIVGRGGGGVARDIGGSSTGGANVSVSAAAGVKRTREAYSRDDISAASESEPNPKSKRDNTSGKSATSSDLRSRRSRRSFDLRGSKSNLSKPAMLSTNNTIDSDDNQDQNTRFHRTTNTDVLQDDSNTSNAAFDFSNQPPLPTLQDATFNNNNNTTADPSTITSMNDANAQQMSGATLYADPQDMAFAQSNHSMTGLPDLSLSSMDDQMFWGNMDSNLFDVFGAVSWENMTGPVGPMASNPNIWDLSGFGNSGSGSGDGNFQGGAGFM